MALVHINIEDQTDGTFSLVADYVGGFDVSSHAHQHALMLITRLETLATRLADPKITVSPLDEVLHGMARTTGDC